MYKVVASQIGPFFLPYRLASYLRSVIIRSLHPKSVRGRQHNLEYPQQFEPEDRHFHNIFYTYVLHIFIAVFLQFSPIARDSRGFLRVVIPSGVPDTSTRPQHTTGALTNMQAETSNHIFGQACVHCNLKKVSSFVQEIKLYGNILIRKD